MGVIGNIPNVYVFNTVSSLSLLLGYECGEFIKILGEVVIVVDKVGVPEGHQVSNELFIGVYWVVLLRWRHVFITSSGVSSVAIVGGVVLTVCIESELCVSIFRFLVISAGLEGHF
jgi:hypothetical protein